MTTNAPNRLDGDEQAEIIVADDDAVILDETDDNTTYTYHTEPADQGGEEYVRCEHCERELLVRLGGKDNLLHSRDCPERDR